MVAITDQSGVGKTTLEVMIDGSKITNIKSHSALLMLRYTLGYVFQNYALVDTDVVWNALDVALTYVKADKQEKNQKKLEVLEKVGLLDKKNNKIYELSGGEQQRIAIARLILKPCKLILADEPTGSVDEETGTKIMELFHDLNQFGKTIIIVTHNHIIVNDCNRIINISA